MEGMVVWVLHVEVALAAVAGMVRPVAVWVEVVLAEAAAVTVDLYQEALTSSTNEMLHLSDSPPQIFCMYTHHTHYITFEILDYSTICTCMYKIRLS